MIMQLSRKRSLEAEFGSGLTHLDEANVRATNVSVLGSHKIEKIFQCRCGYKYSLDDRSIFQSKLNIRGVAEIYIRAMDKHHTSRPDNWI